MNTHNNSHNISYYILYLFYAFIETNLKQKIKIEFFFSIYKLNFTGIPTVAYCRV